MTNDTDDYNGYGNPEEKRLLLDRGERYGLKNKSLGDSEQKRNRNVLERDFSCKETVAPGCPDGDPSGFRTIKKFKKDPDTGINYD